MQNNYYYSTHLEMSYGVQNREATGQLEKIKIKKSKRVHRPNLKALPGIDFNENWPQ